MTEVTSVVLLLAILIVISLAFGMSGGGSYHWKASETDPFAGRHIHIVTTQADLDRLPCDVRGCRYFKEPTS